MEHLA